MERFEESILRYATREYERTSIGVLREKTVHAVLKDFYAGQEEDCKEIRIGNYIADVFRGGEIFEIQSAHFGQLRRKLDSFLPDYPVHVIYPFAHCKMVHWVDPQTGEISASNKSPIKGSVYEAFPEFYRICSYWGHPNLILEVMLIDMDEFRLKDGYARQGKKGSHRYDVYPRALYQRVVLASREDFLNLIPDEVLTMHRVRHRRTAEGEQAEASEVEGFTTKELAAYLHVRRTKISFFITVMKKAGYIKELGKSGRAGVYGKVQEREQHE